MKHILFLVFLSLVITGCQVKSGKPESNQSLSPEQVAAKIESLRDFIIPPKGTSKEDIDAVFGVPKEIKEFTKGSAADYPMHTYQLLTFEQEQESRAFLYVTYRNDKVHFIGINHYYVVKNRDSYHPDSPEYLRQQKEIEGENIHVFDDLLEIKKKYENKLENASWNK